jgi:type II secretion system protein I
LSKHLNNTGLTLLELLLSMAILSIVILSFMAIFSQLITFSVKVEDKVTAINIAEEVLNNVKKSDPSSFDPITINGKTYYPSITIGSNQTPQESGLGLKRVHVKIYTDEHFDSTTKPESEIYGYIESGG